MLFTDKFLIKLACKSGYTLVNRLLTTYPVSMLYRMELVAQLCGITSLDTGNGHDAACC